MTYELRSAFWPGRGALTARHGLGVGFAGLLVAGLLAAPAPARAQAPTARILLSYQAGETEAGKVPRLEALRPNVLQEIFAYVENKGEAQAFTVQVLANGVPVATQKVTVAKEGLLQVPWGPALAADKKAELKEVRGKVAFRLLDAGGKPLGEDLPVLVDPPANYVVVDEVQFDPGSGGKNRLVVKVSAKKKLNGPRCRVELDLRPERIPGLVVEKKKGNYAGNLPNPGETLYLIAEDLQFTGDEATNGLVYLTVDGYERAFTFKTTFARSGSASDGVGITVPNMTLTAAEASVPKAAFPVAIEVNNLKDAVLWDKAQVKLELFTPLPKEVSKEGGKYSELAEFRGERSRRLFFSKEGPGGGLLFRSEVKDWSANVDLSDVFGATKLRVRLLDEKGNPLKDKPGGADLEVVKGIVIDDTPPEEVRFVEAPEKATRGKMLKLQASGTDGDSDIRDVVFFVGKMLPGDKLPPDAPTQRGEPVLPAGKVPVWSADLPVAGDEKTPLRVGVRFTNRVGLTKTASLTLAVEDPAGGAAKGPKAKKASIAGRVLEGTRGQNGLTVALTDAKGKVVQTKTADGGKFAFTDLEPGPYRVSVTKPTSNTRGQATVVLEKEEAKKGVEIKLFR